MFNLDDLTQQAGDAIDALSPQPVRPQISQAPRPDQPQPDQGNLVSRVFGGIMHALTGGDAPQQSQALGLSPDQIAQARPSFWQAMVGTPVGGTPHDVYLRNLSQQVELNQAAQAMQQQKAILVNRAAVFGAFPPPTTGDRTDTIRWINQVTPRLAQDPTALKMLDDYYQRLTADETANRPIALGAQDMLVSPTGSKLAENPALKVGLMGQPQVMVDPKTNQTYFVRLNPLTQQVERIAVGGNLQPTAARNVDVIQGNTNVRYNRSQLTQEQGAFNKAIQPYTQKVAAMDTLEGLINDQMASPKESNYGPIATQFIKTFDQASTRKGMLDFYTQHFGSSLGTTWEQFINRIRAGKLPDDIVQNMLATVRSQRPVVRDLIEAERQKALQGTDQRDALDLKLDTSDQLAHMVNPDATAGTPLSTAPSTVVPKAGPVDPAKVKARILGLPKP